mgnify:CR=1 FL=1
MDQRFRFVGESFCQHEVAGHGIIRFVRGEVPKAAGMEVMDLWEAVAEALIGDGRLQNKFDLRPDIQLDTRVTGAKYDDASRRWSVVTDRDDRVEAGRWLESWTPVRNQRTTRMSVLRAYPIANPSEPSR